MRNTADQSRNRLQLARTYTSVNIKVGAKEHQLETRLHLIYLDNTIFMNILYLTSSSQNRDNWLVGFDPVADRICSFNSRPETAIAANCLLDALGCVDVSEAPIDMSFCRSLVQSIISDSETTARQSLNKLCRVLNARVLSEESTMGSGSTVDSGDGTSAMRRESLSLSLAIDNHELSSGLSSMLRIGGQRADDTLLLTLDAEATPSLSKVDFNDDVKVSIDIGKGTESIFGGKVTEAKHQGDNRFAISCRSYALTLEDTMIPGLVMRVSGAAEQIYYVLRTSGWPPDKLSIDGLDVREKTRFCLVLTPIANIRADNPFGIGDVTFAELEEEQKDALTRLIPETSRNFPRLDEDKIWAKTYVPALHFYEAQVSGTEKIDMALDLLSDVKSDSRLFHLSDEGYIPVSWKRSDRFSRVTREPWVYIQDLATKECILASTEYVFDARELEMSPSLLSRLERGTDKLQILFQRPWDELNAREKSLVYALHWLHRAREEGTDADKLVYSWNALEFISAASKTQRLFSKEEIRAITKLAHDSVGHDDPKRAQKTERMKELLPMLNNPSLLTQLRRLTESADVSLSEEEWEHVRIARDKRNAIIHGRSNIVFDDDEAAKLAFVVSKIISGLSLKI